MKGKYHVLELGSKGAEETIQKFCQTNGQMLLPVVDLITEARLAVDEVIDRAGRGLIETILSMSAEQIAGPKSPGKASGEVRWHGRQLGRVKLADRQLRVERPRLRRKGGGEEAVPAYEALRKSEKTGEEMFEALLNWNKLFGLPTVTSLHPFASSGSLRDQAVPTASFPPFPRPENRLRGGQTLHTWGSGSFSWVPLPELSPEAAVHRSAGKQPPRQMALCQQEP